VDRAWARPWAVDRGTDAGEDYVTRPAEAPVGKVLPPRLTPRGRRRLEKASAAVRSVEVRMPAGMTETEQSAAFRILRSMVHSLQVRSR
jgi:hypothetical protein